MPEGKNPVKVLTQDNWSTNRPV